MDGQDYYTALLAKYVNGSASEAETAELMQELDRNTDSEAWQNMIRQVLETGDDAEDYDHARWNSVVERILHENNTRPIVRRINERRWLPWVAAAVIVIISGVAYLWNTQNVRRETSNVREQTLVKADVPPGGNHATLTLDDGKTITLDSAANGTLLAGSKTTVIKKEGSLEYSRLSIVDSRSTTNDSLTAIHTLTTPRGGQYQLQLPDGSKVWLNAASSITYPTAFTQKERKVTVTGEAYFEVAKDKTKPFIVATKRTQVRVLGTHFNVNAYEDEGREKVTLAEGSVNVAALENSRLSIVDSRILSPGQQASIVDSRLSIVENIDLEQVFAWKNGMFLMSNTDLPAIMRQISRWYDVDIVFEEKPRNETFGGGISRNLPLSEILDLLNNSGVRFRLEGKRLYVRP